MLIYEDPRGSSWATLRKFSAKTRTPRHIVFSATNYVDPDFVCSDTEVWNNKIILNFLIIIFLCLMIRTVCEHKCED